MEYTTTRPETPLSGRLALPGDKSLSHRAVLFAAIAKGTSELSGVLESADVRSTIAAIEALGAGVDVIRASDGSLDISVTGWGAVGPSATSSRIDCGNSGTTARLLLGILAAWNVEVTLTGDESLSLRPMLRVIEPLSSMGAELISDTGTLPVIVRGGGLRPIAYDTPVASAQVKTAILLAGLRASGRTMVREPAPSRDHTERLLPAFGVHVGRDPSLRSCWVDGPVTPVPGIVRVPGDPSSAAFIVAAGTLVPESDVTIAGLALNPTRTAFIDVLVRMGADVVVEESDALGLEPVGSLRVRHTSRLVATTIHAEEVPSLIDEVPVLALIAGLADGVSRFESVGELRVKESDRLAAVIDGLTTLGVRASAEGDCLVVEGPSVLRGAALDSLGDHRLAMTWALAGLVASEPVTVRRFEAVDVSYPCFADDLVSLGAPPA